MVTLKQWHDLKTGEVMPGRYFEILSIYINATNGKLVAVTYFFSFLGAKGVWFFSYYVMNQGYEANGYGLVGLDSVVTERAKVVEERRREEKRGGRRGGRGGEDMELQPLSFLSLLCYGAW